MGAYCGNELIFGFLTVYERKQHINYLELLADFFGLKCFAKKLVGREILLKWDNTTAVSYIGRKCGVQYHLERKCRSRWRFPCQESGYWMGIVRDGILEYISIDLFASRVIKKGNDYCSCHRDPEALAADAFTLACTLHNYLDSTQVLRCNIDSLLKTTETNTGHLPFTT